MEITKNKSDQNALKSYDVSPLLVCWEWGFWPTSQAVHFWDMSYSGWLWDF